MVENFFDACNESLICSNCCADCLEVKRKCRICCMSKSCRIGCAWLALLFYELVFWGLFTVILFYISRFLLGSIDTKNETVKLVVSYIIIGVASLILVWLNTDLIIYSKDNQENPGARTAAEHSRESRQTRAEQ